MSSSDEFIVVGRLGAPHGVRGGITLKPLTEDPSTLADLKPLYLRRGDGWHPLSAPTVKDHSRPGKPRLLLQLAGVDDRDAAALLRGLEIGIPATALPRLEEGAYYWRDLKGLKALDPSGATLGVVTDVIDSPAHAVLAIDTDAAQEAVLVPFVERYTGCVDLDAGTIVIDWPEAFEAKG